MKKWPFGMGIALIFFAVILFWGLQVNAENYNRMVEPAAALEAFRVQPVAGEKFRVSFLGSRYDMTIPFADEACGGIARIARAIWNPLNREILQETIYVSGKLILDAGEAGLQRAKVWLENSKSQSKIKAKSNANH